jgi:Tol biopolymer transport system component
VSLEGKVTKIPVKGVVTSATFSPDGSSIVLSLHPGDHRTDLYTMRVDGSHLTQITKTPEDEEFGDWGP